MRPIISIIGTGNVGQTLATVWHNEGYTIAGVANRSPQSAQQLAQRVNAKFVDTYKEAVDLAELILLSVSDDAISDVANQLNDVDWHGKAVIHTSGAASVDVLHKLADVGAMIGSLHPAFPFSDVETAAQNIYGATFATEANHAVLREWLMGLVNTVNGNEIRIPIGQKALYHAALTIASNYTVTLFATAQALLQQISDDDKAIHQALYTLVDATVKNIGEQGIPDALTGALSRADVGTLRSHVDALSSQDDMRDAYIQLARLTYPMLQQRGIDTDIIEQVLRKTT